MGGEECTRFGGNDNLKEFCIQIVLQVPLKKLRLKIVEKKDGSANPRSKKSLELLSNNWQVYIHDMYLIS